MTVPVRLAKVLAIAALLSALTITMGYQALKSQTNIFANIPATVDLTHYGKL